jgi:hypothetical protein
MAVNFYANVAKKMVNENFSGICPTFALYGTGE